MNKEHIRRVELSAVEVSYVWFMAQQCTLGGNSHIRGENRAETVSEDNFVGQLGEAALSKYLTGGLSAYYQQRMLANLNPLAGDKGQDIPGLALDVKTSLRRNKSSRVGNMHLYIRQPELHDNHVYILAIVEPNAWTGNTGTVERDKPVTVYLVGWIETAQLPDPEENNGTLRFTVPVKQLYPLMPLNWQFP